MKHGVTAALFAALVLMAPEARADAIERACLKSEREAASRILCSCIQGAADQTLTGRDQRTGATFFDNPQAAQDMRMSDRSSHEAFWDRWRNFGETAEALCS